MNWLDLYWLSVFRRGGGYGHAVRVTATAAILFGAAPAWTQNEGSQSPNPENAFQSATVASYLARFARPQTAEAAPRNSQKHTQRVRMVKPKPVVVEAAAPQIVPPEPPPPASPSAQEWPSAQENVGAAGLVPVVIKTVREMVEPEPEMPTVLENELSDIDLRARPILDRDDIFAATDGRATAEEDLRGNRFAAFAENMKTISGASWSAAWSVPWNFSWLEPLVLALAGAFAAIAAMRFFAA